MSLAPGLMIYIWFRTKNNDIYCHSNASATRHVYARGSAIPTQVVISAVCHNCWDYCQLIVCRDGDVCDAARITYSLIATLSGFIIVGVIGAVVMSLFHIEAGSPFYVSVVKGQSRLHVFILSLSLSLSLSPMNPSSSINIRSVWEVRS
jgi:hypothetical protein